MVPWWFHFHLPRAHFTVWVNTWSLRLDTGRRKRGKPKKNVATPRFTRNGSTKTIQNWMLIIGLSLVLPLVLSHAQNHAPVTFGSQELWLAMAESCGFAENPKKGGK